MQQLEIQQLSSMEMKILELICFEEPAANSFVLAENSFYSPE